MPRASRANSPDLGAANAIRIGGQFELFEETHFLDTAWKLSDQVDTLAEAEFPSRYVAGETGELYVSEQGKVEIRFFDQAQRQLRLMGIEPGWDLVGLTNWLDRQIVHPDITRVESTLFIHRVLTELIESRGLALDQLAQQEISGYGLAIAAKDRTASSGEQGERLQPDAVFQRAGGNRG